ncbi:transporter substrate-binding domain-containing protein [Shewanella sp. Isolate11]|uniref:ATP-binding protein n=1 Tax=Shewanella sp. Isolate11 TaxID=2908530 RepID=UPI001EFCCF15|nr:transporter substrate-binding domain-containing protein [Shewanella sp. Isolate11]MCG9697614.1 transporter substrate-binding domain-containing protein [Shewanella sp. Isolate11]
MRYLWLLLISLPFAVCSQESIVFGVHSNTAPLEWRNNGVDQGFNLELLERIGQRIDKRILVRRKSFQQLVYDVHQPDSDIDIIAVVSPVTLDRQLSQSDPIYVTHAKAYTLHGSALITSWLDLQGKRVAIKNGSFVDVYLSGSPQQFERIDVDLYETGFQQMIDNQVDVVIAESFVARRLLPLYPAVRSSSDALIFGAFNFVANKEKAALMSQINDALRQLKLSGEYDELVNKWFGTGREKVDLTSTEQKVFVLAIFIASISALGMLYTGYISLRLRRRTQALDMELKHRHRVEAEISELSTQFQSVLDGIPHGVTIISQTMQRLWSNDNNIQLLVSEEFQYADGQPFLLKTAVLEVLNTQQSIKADMHYRQQFWQLQIHPIAQDQVVVLLEESTEQHRLRQANEESSRLASLGELSAGIAHEINNPTGLIVHAASLFSAAIKDLAPASSHYQKQNPFWQVAGLAPDIAIEELQHSCQTIEDGAQRIGRIVHDLKRYAMPHIADEHSIISLNEVVQVSLRLTANQTKTLQLNLNLYEPSPTISGDAQQLQQVLINLIQNACHACEAHAGVICIETTINQDKAVLKISDNGCGMDNDTLKRVTEPFFTTKRTEGGTGLGLSVSSRIIKQHHGQMQMQSRLNKGTSISLTFALQQ